MITLVKAKGIHFVRTRDNEFMAYFIDENGNRVITMEPKEIFEGEVYGIIFGTTLVVGREVIPEIEGPWYE